MKSNTLNINSSEPIVIIPLEEYDYLKSLEDSINIRKDTEIMMIRIILLRKRLYWFMKLSKN